MLTWKVPGTPGRPAIPAVPPSGPRDVQIYGVHAYPLADGTFNITLTFDGRASDVRMYSEPKATIAEIFGLSAAADPLDND